MFQKHKAVVVARTILGLSVFALLVKNSSQHGYLEEPAARNCAWRFGYKTPVNFDDNGLNCGGFAHQWFTNEGKCGVCGDNYSGPRLHEVGGMYATGAIVRTYGMGQVIDITILVTANHLGYMQFRICPTNSKLIEATQQCLENNVLEIVGYGQVYPVREGERTVKMKVKLPDYLSCSHCVLQWKYRAGNSWGSDETKNGPGVGPQEEFYNCADIKIVSDITDFIPSTEVPAATVTLPMPVEPYEHFVETTTWSILSTEVVAETTEVLEWIEMVETTEVPVDTTELPIEIISTAPPITQHETVEGNDNEKFSCKRLPVEWAALASRKQDTNEFYGMPVCYLIGRSRLKCKDCYENCITPYRQCPRRDCFCKWYPDL